MNGEIILKRLMCLLLFAGALLVSGCGGSEGPAGSGASGKTYTDISVAQLREMLAKKDFVLVNTHIPFQGEIEKTDLSIPFHEIDERLDELPGKGAKIVLYCRSGSMSTDAAETLVERGYTNVYELDGGMIAWEDAGLPLEGR